MAKKSKKTSLMSSFNSKNITMALIGLVVGVGGTILTQASFAAPGGKGGGGYTGAITGTVLVDDKNANGMANFGDTITFSVSSNYPSDTTAGPWVDLYCYQNGTFVYSQTAGFGKTYPWAPNFTLSSAYWTSGPANCTANLYSTGKNGRQAIMATYKFDVAS